MATGSFGGQLQSAISGRLTADPYEKRRKAAMGDYQAQAEKSRKDLSERLNRLGVLRGGGATASQFGEFESGVVRGQQALGAQFEAQREAGIGQAIQQGLGLYGTDQQYGLAGRQQTEAERMGQFSRELGTREFQSQDALRRDQQREAERSALAQEGMQRGALTGMYGGQRTLDQQRQDLAYRTGLAQTFGTDLGGDDTSRQTEARSQRLQQEAFQRAGLTGQLGDDRTLAAQQLYGRPDATTTLQGQELELRRGELLGEIGQERTLAAQQALGSIDGEDTLARDALQQDATQASMERGLRRTEGLAERNLRSSQAGLDRQATADLQTAQFGEAALEREARLGESQADRELRAIQSQQQYNLATSEGAAERASRAALQQAQFGEAAIGREFQQTESTRDREFQMQMRASELEAQGIQASEARQLAREELYGSANPMEWDRTLASTGQRAQIAAENRRLAEMETAGASQRGLAERELTQRSAMAAQQRALDREQLYGRAMTRAEQESGLGYAGGTLGAQELSQRESEAALERQSQADLLAQSGRQDITRDTGMNRFNIQMEGARQEFERGERGLDRELTRGESAEAREMQGYLANVDRVQQEQDRALRGELGRGQLGQEARRMDLAQTEMYGQDVSGMSPMQIRALGGTLGAREAAAGRGLEGRRLDEVERASRLNRELQREELYGGADVDPRTGTLASREARAERTSREGLAARDIAARESEGRLGRGLAREELYGTGDAQQQMGATLAAREAEAGRTFERGERALDRGVTTAEGAAARSLAREELYGTGDPMQQDRSLAAQDLDLRGELGRGELAERVTAGAQGRALDRDRLGLQEAEVFGEGRGQRYGGRDTLQSRLAGEASDRYRREEQRQAIGMMQNLPDDYAVSEREAQIVRDMLGIEGESDLAINEAESGHRWATTPEERDKLFNPYGMSLSGYRTPAVDPT